MKKLRYPLTLLLMCLVLNACGTSDDRGQSAPSESAALDDAAENSMDTEAVETAPEELDSSKVQETAPEELERKVLQNASLELEAESTVDTYQEIVRLGEKYDGYEASYTLQNLEDYSIINAVYRVPSDKLKVFLGEISNISQVINSQLQTEDITDNYYDVQTRLETMRKSLTTYYKLLENADTVEEIIQLQQTIDNITLSIESYEGQLKVWNSMTSMSSVSLLIRQENDPIKLKKDIEWNSLSLNDVGYLIKSGFLKVLDLILMVLQFLLIVLSISFPIWGTLLLVLFLIHIYRKKHPKAKKRSDNKKDLTAEQKNDFVEK